MMVISKINYKENLGCPAAKKNKTKTDVDIYLIANMLLNVDSDQQKGTYSERNLMGMSGDRSIRTGEVQWSAAPPPARLTGGN